MQGNFFHLYSLAKPRGKTTGNTLAAHLRSNMTDAEILLWSKLRGKQLKGYQFSRQKIIGNYIADFYCPKSKLVVEIDGGQHYCAEGVMKDKKRDNYMSKAEITVLRFSDREVLCNLDVVVEKIWSELGIIKSPLTPLCQRGEIG